MDRKGKKFCKDCGMSSYHHIQTWLDEFTNCFLPRITLPRKIESFFDAFLEKIFTFLKLASFRDDFTSSDIQLRSTCFIEELRKRGVAVQALRGPVGYTNHFRAEMEPHRQALGTSQSPRWGEHPAPERQFTHRLTHGALGAWIDGKVVRFESLPIADFISTYGTRLVDDKEKTKRHLEKGDFPIAEGKSFWFWQKKKAVAFGIKELGCPLVVKPRGGSVSRHITTNIQDFDELKGAIDKAVIYSPAFIVEKFIPRASVYRATVIDFDYVACVKQVPANVVGNGISTIRALIERKNSDPKRGESRRKEYTLYKIIENETTEKLLSERGYAFSSVPKKDEIVFLQHDPFLKLGGDLIEVTPHVHPDNFKLFRQVARFFDIRVVGIDFLAEDISRSYKGQQCAILELNSVPCIELHHFPSSGAPQNVARAVADLFFKYYL